MSTVYVSFKLSPPDALLTVFAVSRIVIAGIQIREPQLSGCTRINGRNRRRSWKVGREPWLLGGSPSWLAQ